jgi:hypothetical protein
LRFSYSIFVEHQTNQLKFYPVLLYTSPFDVGYFLRNFISDIREAYFFRTTADEHSLLNWIHFTSMLRLSEFDIWQEVTSKWVCIPDHLGAISADEPNYCSVLRDMISVSLFLRNSRCVGWSSSVAHSLQCCKYTSLKLH